MKIILAVDGSKHSTWAADLLLKLPLSEEPDIHVLRVVELAALTHPRVKTPHALEYGRVIRKAIAQSLADAKQLTTKIAGRLRMRWKNVDPVVEEGHAAQAIIEMAVRKKADLVVLGSRGLSNIRSFLMGSVSQKVATYAPCPVLVVKRKTPRLKKVLVGLDASKYSDDAVAFLQSHFLPERIQCTVLYAWEQPLPLYLPKMAVTDFQERFREVMRKAGFVADVLFVFGHPAKEIVKAAGKKRMDLVVVGSRGLTGAKQFLLGSVSHMALKHSPASILIVRRR